MNLRKLLGYSEIVEEIEKNKSTYRKLYVEKDLTARKVAENQNISYSNNLAKALLRIFGKKGKGYGGSRQGSGNKKGIKFCGKCRQTLPNCTCD